ncbi:MAG: hypothetical protein R3C56_25835 [Pirellulaceae bacterium]
MGSLSRGCQLGSAADPSPAGIGWISLSSILRSQSPQNFIAFKDGKPAGRITALVNHGHNERFEEKRGFFGFFESIDDSEVSNRLLTEACRYLVGQGMTDVRVRAIRGLTTNWGCWSKGLTPPRS